MRISKKVKRATAIILVALMFISVAASFAFAEDATEANEEESKLNQDLEYLGKMINYIITNHPSEITEKELMQGALKGVFQQLDEYSSYYTSDEFKELNIATSGTFGGVGIRITEREGYVTVIAPIEGTPGAESGIQPKDKIVSVDDRDIVGMPIGEAVKLIRGEPGTDVKLGVIRDGEKETLYFTITRDTIKINPISYEVKNDQIGYIRISDFNSNTLLNINEALEFFDQKNMSKLIIDIRNNPGGFLSQVIEVLKSFVPKGPIVHIKGANGELKTYSSNLEESKYELAVLVNGGSASASEIFAGAVQDSGVGTIIGTTTYGKGSVQKVLSLTNGGGMKITIAEYLTPNENEVNEVGITPDIIVENNINTTDIDTSQIPELSKKRKPTVGMVGLDVLAAEQILQILDYNVAEPDGVFDDLTVKALKKFQVDKELHSYGVLDFTTQDELTKALEEYTKPKVEDLQLQKAIEILTQN